MPEQDDSPPRSERNVGALNCSCVASVRANGHAAPQFIEEVQQEYNSVLRRGRGIGRCERDDVLAVRRRIIASRRAEADDLS